MPNSPIAQQALEAAQGLGGQITDLTDKVDKLTTSNEELTRANERLADSNTRQRHWIIALGVMGWVVAAVVVVLIVALVKVHDATRKAVKASDLAGLVQQYQSQGCEASNASRALEKKLWDNLIARNTALAAQQGKPLTQAEQKALAATEKDISVAYPQRDCTGVKEGVVKNTTTSTSVPQVPQK